MQPAHQDLTKPQFIIPFFLPPVLGKALKLGTSKK
jgi:hypothetical protein